MSAYFNLSIIFLLCISAVFIACEPEDDDDAITPDPGGALVGDYKMDSYQVHIYDNAGALDTITVIKKPVIKLKANNNTKANELRIDLLEFMEVTAPIYDNPNHNKLIRIKNSDEATIVKITGREFNIKEIYYDWIITDGVQTWVWPFDFNAKGKFDKGKVSLQFEITHFDGINQYTWKGTATGEKVR